MSRDAQSPLSAETYEIHLTMQWAFVSHLPLSSAGKMVFHRHLQIV